MKNKQVEIKKKHKTLKTCPWNDIKSFLKTYRNANWRSEFNKTMFGKLSCFRGVTSFVPVCWCICCLQIRRRTLSLHHSSLFSPQLLPPAAEPQTVDFFSSIFIDWLSARDSNLVTVDTPRTALLLGFIPFDTGIRVAALRADCTSELGWNIDNKTIWGIIQTRTHRVDL